MAKFVFGMGTALINHWKIIKKNYNPDYGVDNDQNKWGKTDTYTNLLCISPEQLQEYEPIEVLITIGDPYIVEKIKHQLVELNIKYKVLVNELDKWSKEEPLPVHLCSLDKSQRKILLFNTPEHDNIGDHLITLAELEFLEKRFADYKIYEITDIEYMWHHSLIKEYVGPEDLILITGGGFLGSLWLYNGECNVRNILKEYPRNRVIILPQTVYFEKNNRGEKELQTTAEIYSQHQHLTICTREKASYQIFSSIIEAGVRLELLPDIALFYKADFQVKNREKIALLCLRSDKERMLSANEHESIVENLIADGWEIQEISMHSGEFSGIDGRKRQVHNKLEEIQKAGLIVTDTLHCMISAAITGTPCIAFDNLSGKVKNVYEWIRDLPYICICDEIAEFEKKMKTVSLEHGKYNLMDLNNYEDRLEKIIRGI